MTRYDRILLGLTAGAVVVGCVYAFMLTQGSRVEAEEQPTHRVRVWCPELKKHMDLRLPGFSGSVVIDVAAACGTPKRNGG